jgi:voltage-gated potassium channel
MGFNQRSRHFVGDVFRQTPFLKLLLLLASLWLLFAGALFLAERGAADSAITSYGQALYWGIAACSTAGIADTPATATGRLIGGTWIVLGSILFFGTIVATITAYFMRPLQRPVRQLVDTIEYNLEQLDRLSVEELEVLKDTTDALILHMEHLRAARDGGPAAERAP